MIEYGANVSAKQRMEAQKKYPGIQFSKASQQQGQTAQKQGAAGQATPNFGSQQQTGGFPSVPQQGQQSAPDMSIYRPPAANQGSAASYAPAPNAPRMTADQTNRFNQRFGFPEGFGANVPQAYGTAAPPQTVNGVPVATIDPSKYQRQIDEMKQRGTWDDPRNAKARERLEQKLADANRAPPGYFVTPDGRLEPNYQYSLYGGAPQQSGPTMTPPQQAPTPAQGGFGNIVPLDYLNLVDRAADEWAGNQMVPMPSPPPPSGDLRAPAPPPQFNVPQGVSAINDLWNYRPPGPAQNTASGGLQNQLAMRDAFIASINNSLMQQQLANGLNAQGAMPPQFNFPALYQQAGQMVSNGWSNPLAALLG